jgi:glycogen(starch) synthase
VRILHLAWEYPPVIYGGLGRHVHALAEAQAAGGDDVVVITQSAPAAPPDEMVNGVRVVRVELDAPEIADWRVHFIEWAFGFNVAVARSGIALGREWSPDVIHGHDWLVAQAAVLLQEALRIPFVLTVHATESGRQGGAIGTDLSRAIDSTEAWAVQHADAVIVCSDFMRDEVVRLFSRTPAEVAVIPNGIDPGEWTSTEGRRRSMRHRYGAPLVVFAGRLEVEKGVQTLVDAMPRVRRSVPGARAVVVGEGGAERELRAHARRRRLGSAMTFAGFVSDAELRATVAAADVAVVPSLYEPFGIVALEAMALGSPLVVARTGGLAAIVEEGRTGWQFAPGDPVDLAAVLTSALTDRRESRRRATAAREAIVSRFSWPAIAAATGAVYRGLLRGTTSRAVPPAAPAAPDGLHYWRVTNGDPTLRRTTT